MRLGLLAAARITGPAVVEPAAMVEGVELTALAARSPERAARQATAWGVPVVHTSYQDLVDDPDLDAIYVATPAALHHRWTLAALDAGKHVLCEKPLAANAVEAREMVVAAEAADRLLMEAFHWRYHPLVGRVREVLDDGRLGSIRHVHGSFCLPDGHVSADDIRWDLTLGGGALMDLGCYPLQWVRWAVGGEPRVVSAEATCPTPDVDGRFGADLVWDDGPTGSIECSMIAEGFDAHLEVVGDHGTLRVTNPLAPQRGSRIELRLGTGDTGDTGETGGTGDTGAAEVSVPGADTTTYQHQLVAFRDAVASNVHPPTSGADSVATMELIDACYRAAGLAPRPSLTSTAGD